MITIIYGDVQQRIVGRNTIAFDPNSNTPEKESSHSLILSLWYTEYVIVIITYIYNTFYKS